jgi:hypothetical protein
MSAKTYEMTTLVKMTPKPTNVLAFMDECIPLNELGCVHVTTADSVELDRRSDHIAPGISQYGIYVGSKPSNIVPEIILDQDGCYILVFKRMS